jgi:hypothetical protein
MTQALRELTKFVTVRYVCDLLGLQKTGPVIDAIHRGELKAVNISPAESRPRKGVEKKTDKARPTWRIAPEDLAAWLESRRAVPTVATPTTRAKRRKATTAVTQYFK